MYSAVYQWSGS